MQQVSSHVTAKYDMATAFLSVMILGSISLAQDVPKTILPGSDVNATNIHLENRLIDYLPDFVFSNYTELARLNLTGNANTNISRDAFTNTSLKYIYLEGNQLTRIPKLTNVGATLGFLDLSENQIWQIATADFEGLSALYYLSIAGNYIYIPFQYLATPQRHSERFCSLIAISVPFLQYYLYN